MIHHEVHSASARGMYQETPPPDVPVDVPMPFRADSSVYVPRPPNEGDDPTEPACNLDDDYDYFN